MTIAVGDRVAWHWGSGTASGEVTERFTSKVTRTLKGSEVTRNASNDEPAFLIEQSDGDRALKSITEVEKK
ncbi:MAG: hypervirulence associated TUDOR domain-containing protein [Paracoccaceae bacterium]